jgi:hypothetical protein
MEPRGQGWLGEEHRLGSAADVTAPRDFQEALDLRQQHRLAIEDFYRTVNWTGRNFS